MKRGVLPFAGLLLCVLLLAILSSCSGDIDFLLFNTFSIQGDGSWKQNTNGGKKVIEETTHPYIAVVTNGKPTDIVTLEGYISDSNCGNGKISKSGSKITYTNTSSEEQQIVIRTDSLDAVIEIDAPSDTIMYYGKAKEVKIIRTADHSYREFGTTAYIECASGRVIAEAGGLIGTVLLTEANDVGDCSASVYRNTNGTINTIYATSNDVAQANNNTTSDHDTLTLASSSGGTVSDWGNVVPVESGSSLESAVQTIQASSVSNLEKACSHKNKGDSNICPDCGFIGTGKWSEKISNLSDFEYSNTEFDIDSAEDLAIISRMIDKGNTFSGKTLNITENIDLKGYLWSCNGSKSFNGTLKGNNKTISNLYISADSTSTCIGLFANLKSGSISDITIDNALIKSTHNDNTLLGVLVGATDSQSTISNVTISNSKIEALASDQVAFITGNSYGTIKDCSVLNCSGKANEQFAAIVGYFCCGSITNCKITACEFSGNDRIGAVVGKFDCAKGNIFKDTLVFEGCTVKSCVVNSVKNAGALTGMIMGDCDQLSIKNHSLDVKLNGLSNNYVFGVLRSGQADAFVSAWGNTDKVSGNSWTTLTSSASSETISNGSASSTVYKATAN